MHIVRTEPALDGIEPACGRLFNLRPHAAMRIAETHRPDGENLVISRIAAARPRGRT